MNGAGAGNRASRGKGEYPCEGAVRFSLDGHLRKRRHGNCLSTLAMSSSGLNRTLFSMESSERLLMISLPCCRSIRERQQELHSAPGGTIAGAAVYYRKTR